MHLRDPINIAEAAVLCGVSDRLIYYWQTEKTPGKPHALKVCGRWLFEREDVEQFARKRAEERRESLAKPGNIRRRKYYERHGK